MKVAVIMSVYHSDDTSNFKLAVDSILHQTYRSDLFIYQDGEVSSSLRDALYKLEHESSIKVIKSKYNKGLATALNKLIETVLIEDYEYVARMDSDDISKKNRIEKQINFLNTNKEIDVVGTSCREFEASFALEEKHLPTRHHELLNFSIARCPFIHPSVMFRASVFKKGYRYPINTSLTEDMALWFILLKDGFKFANINEILLDYRLNENTITRRTGIKKAFLETSLRLKYMFLLKQVTLKNFLLVCSRIIFHLLPSSLVKLAYKKFR